jgi:hypothetical protein
MTSASEHVDPSFTRFLHPKELAMQANVGTIDRIIRVVAGLVLIGLTATGHIGTWGWIGVVPLLTGLARVCPAYSILGIKTCPAPKSGAK